MLMVIFKIVLSVSVCAMFGWAVIMHLKKGVAHEKTKVEKSDNVLDINTLKVRRCEDNLKLFLEADEALAKNQTERFFALYMKAIESTKKGLREQQRAGIRRVS